MSDQGQVGFSQRLQLDWLERTSSLLLANMDKLQIQAALQEYLQDKLSVGSSARKGNRSKAISNLLRIWVDVPPQLRDLRDDGLEHLIRLPVGDHLPIHWGMTSAVYPFFASIAETVGRLLRLQGEVAAIQVQRRVREQFGERETVERAAQRVLRCFIDWGTLQETGALGVYSATSVRTIDDPQLTAWLLEATLIASDAHTGALATMTQSALLFPFAITPITRATVNQNVRLELFRQGLDEDIVMLRGSATGYR